MEPSNSNTNTLIVIAAIAIIALVLFYYLKEPIAHMENERVAPVEAPVVPPAPPAAE